MILVNPLHILLKAIYLYNLYKLKNIKSNVQVLYVAFKFDY